MGFWNVRLMMVFASEGDAIEMLRPTDLKIIKITTSDKLHPKRNRVYNYYFFFKYIFVSGLKNKNKHKRI